MKRLLTPIFCFTLVISHGQFKADNVKYKTVFPEDLCKTLKDNPGYVLLDVRSDGEFNDTMSSSPALNIGHLQNALHINITQLPQRWKELNAYKDKPLFIYCSHSQRSRRASRLLADSGFTKIYNINGGLTNFYDQGIQSTDCDAYSIVTTIPYKIISPKQLADTKTSYYIIDLRNDSAFTGKSLDERVKMQGRFANAVNIPFDKLASSGFAIPSKPILLVDDFGSQSPNAAKLLVDKGFKDVSILFGGMDEWVSYITNTNQKPSIKWNSFSNYKMLSPDEFNTWMKQKEDFALIDVRPQDQFNNKSKNYFENIGQIQNAVNIPYATLASASGLPSKSTPVVVYGFNGQNDIFNAAKWFREQDYQNVYVLEGGIWNLRWASHNIKGKQYLNDWVVNVPEQNQ
ncbi:MAG: rhodanese-like domain-containing protein [Flavisolibacter sp.]